MNKVEAATEDELRPEYDLESLQVRKSAPDGRALVIWFA